MALPVEPSLEMPKFCSNGHEMLKFGYQHSDSRKQRRYWGCKECEKFYKIKYRFKMTQEQYWALMDEQNFCCAICTKEFNNEVLKDKPYIDHDHACCPGNVTCGNCVRGIICMRCNTLLGLAEDNIDILLSAINFLTTGGE